MSNMVASLRLKGKVDSSLTKALGKTDKDMARSARLAKGRAGAMTRAAEDQARATGKAANETGRLARSMSKATTGSQRLGRNLKKNIKQMREAGMASKLLNRGLDSVANKWTGLGAGATLMLAGRQVGNLQERMVRLANAANKPIERINALKEKIYQAALDDNIRLDPAQLISAVEKIVEKTGNLDLAENNLKELATVIQATGSEGVSIGALFSDLNEKMGLTNALTSMDLLVKQGKQAAFPLKDLALYAPRAAAAYSALGRTGVEGLTEMGSLLQVAYMGTGDSSSASTVVEALSRDLVAQVDNLNKLGVQLWDEEASLAAGKRVARSIPEVLNEVLESTGGDIESIQKAGVFTDESMKILKVLVGETGRAKMADLMKALGDGNDVRKDSAAVARTFNQSLGSLAYAWNRFADENLTGAIDTLASALDALGSEGANTLFSGLAVAGAGLGALWGGRAINRAGRSLGLWGKKGKKSGKAGGLLGDLTGGGPMAVQVVNWPGGGFGGGDSFFDSGGGNSRRAGKVGRTGRLVRKGGGLLKGAGRLVGKAFRPLGMLMGATNLVGAVRSGSKSMVGRTAGSMVGGMGGGALGAMLGSFVLPGIGTAVGGVLGSVIGDIIGEKTGEVAGQALESSPAEAPAMAAAGEKSVVIHVHAAPGMDIEELARKVAMKVRRPGTGDLYDG
jgi:hypothetical protein